MNEKVNWTKIKKPVESMDERRDKIKDMNRATLEQYAIQQSKCAIKLNRREYVWIVVVGISAGITIIAGLSMLRVLSLCGA